MHKPVLDQAEAVGHAVRGAYMYTAMADLSEATGYNRYLKASQRIWEDVTRGKIYITGGIGSKEHGEAFGESFELPNMTAYTETCASVANVFWNHRLYRARVMQNTSMYWNVLFITDLSQALGATDATSSIPTRWNQTEALSAPDGLTVHAARSMCPFHACPEAVYMVINR
jgi:DUF1680 family protein